jgi:hypothetical protein
MKLLLAAIAFAAFAPSALASTPRELYVAGKFDQAERAALAEGTAAGFALAARSELAAETMRASPCMECLKHAEQLAQRAIDANPKLAEAHIEYVIALGYEARVVGMIQAQFRGFAKKAKEHIDAALAVDPGNPWAWAALGNWNIEIVADGGPTMARILYGATAAKGLADFARAFAAEPDSLVLQYHYALALASYDRNVYRDTIMNALTRAAAGVPKTVYEFFAKNCARELLATLRSGDMQSFDRLVRHDQGYP